MPEETNPVWEKVKEIRENLSDSERKAIEISWQHWINNGSLITKKKLAGFLKDNSLLTSMLGKYPAMVKLLDRDDCSYLSNTSYVVTPTLIGILCMRNWCEIHGDIKLLIEMASCAYSSDSEINVMESDSLQAKISFSNFPPSTLTMLQYVGALLPDWSMRILQNGSWRVYFPENISNVAFGHLSPEDYLAGAVKEMLENHKAVEVPNLLLFNDVIYRHFHTADSLLQQYAESLIPLMNTVVDNLAFESKEHWANAVHSMRRVLQMLADQLFPPSKTDRVRRNGKPISVGPKDYINRLICYVEDHSGSSRFISITCANLEYLGNRLDAVYDTFNKGAHSEVFTRDEAEMYIIYGYLLVRDILSLVEEAESSKRIT